MAAAVLAMRPELWARGTARKYGLVLRAMSTVGALVGTLRGIAAGDILLVVPDAIGVSCRSRTGVPGGTDRKLPDGSSLQHVLTKMATSAVLSGAGDVIAQAKQ